MAQMATARASGGDKVIAALGLLGVLSYPLSEAAAAPAASEGCEREVRWVNRTGQALGLQIEGLSSRRLQAGQVARWCAPASLVAYTARGDGWTYRAQVVVASGERRSVELAAPGATVQIINRTAEHQSLLFDGEAIGELAPGQSKVFGPLATGERQITARSLRSAWAWGKSVQLSRGQRLTVELPVPTGVLRLINPLAELAQLAIDGKPYGAVEAGARLAAVGVGPGAHKLRWVGVASGAVAWQVAAADDAQDRQSPEVEVRVANKTGEKVLLPEGLRNTAVELAAHATATWRLPRGDYGVVATGAQSGLSYKLDVLSRGPSQLSWTLKRPTATLQLVNASGDPVKVNVPALGPLAIPEGKTALLRVPAGRLALTAEQPHREEPLKMGLFLQGGEHATWRIAARETSLTAINHWAETLELWIDGRLVGHISPRKEFRVPLPPGAHELEIQVVRLGWREKASLSLRDGDRLSVQFDPPGGGLHLSNRQPADSLELFVDGQRAASVAPGKQAAVAVTQGKWPVRVVGKDGRQAEQQVAVTPTQQVQLEPPAFAAVEVKLGNYTDRDLKIAIDGAPLRTLAAGAEWKIGALAAGDHLLAVVDQIRESRALIQVHGRKSTLELQIRLPAP